MPRLLLAISLLLLQMSADAGSLVRYSFDDDQLDTGPDTFRIFEYSRGTVNLSSRFPFSGYYSVEIRDADHDGGFPELQGFFPMQASGTLHVHFAFMTPEPDEPFNIALAGPKWFSMKKDGIGFWLNNKHGYFQHMSDNSWKRLNRITPFEWYLVDLSYHVSEGRYDLQIREAHTDKPLVDITGAMNAAGTADSKVYVFSFIGDLPDRDNAVIYVDDIDIESSLGIHRSELIAPGRRKLFIDYWQDLQKASRNKVQCVPYTTFADFGIDNYTLSVLRTQGQLQTLQQLLHAPLSHITTESIDALSASPELVAVALWRLGCGAMDNRDPQQALVYFRGAEQATPGGKIYNLSQTLALAALNRFDEVDSRIASVYGLWYGDTRFAAAEAMIGMARGDLWASENVLREPAEAFPDNFDSESLADLWSDAPSTQLIQALQAGHPDDWPRYLKQRLVAEQYFFVLLWREAYTEAFNFAQRMADGLAGHGRSAGVWLEFQGNAAFLMGDYGLAEQRYESALEQNSTDRAGSGSVYLKLSDLYFLIGDAENERHYRELVYGSLDEQ
ncbi:hypothetical protein DFR30_1698 [Thiogranum longum]|uniref:Tetratricopeptide repeat protein n=1 Tax=Thiogranum longum TaxID=1537524 RepID=A0A4R1HE22_9GAMM|nr:hypothetical protein [Thiogranum longum]TCK18420.1 hypothetical protein DFR30_1698 [Thiogranum longum]